MFHRKLQVVIIAGESSGDLLASFIIRSLKDYFPLVNIQGIGGPLTEKAAGPDFSSWTRFENLGVMGFFLTKIWFFYRLIVKTAKRIQSLKPDLLITIDSPELCLRISRRVAKTCIRAHFVPPAVWAWRPGRARKIHQSTDHLFCLFPFESSYFPQMSCFFVGHPVLESPLGSPDRFWSQHPDLCSKAPLICLLPGSRKSEIQILSPLFHETLQLIRAECKEAQGIVISLTPPPLFWPQEIPWIICNTQQQADAFSASTVALAASGTVGLQLLRQKTPMVIAYRISRIMSWIVKPLIKTKFVSLVNILAQKEIVSECLQNDCVPSVLAQKVLLLLRDHQKKALAQKEELQSLMAHLSPPEPFHDRVGKALQDILQFIRKEDDHVV
jgi:lipid-A-disaccharide synthase